MQRDHAKTWNRIYNFQREWEKEACTAISASLRLSNAGFSLLLFTPHAGSEREAERFLVELEHKVSEKKYMRFDTVIDWFRAWDSLIVCAKHCRGSIAPRKAFNVCAKVMRANFVEFRGNLPKLCDISKKANLRRYFEALIVFVWLKFRANVWNCAWRFVPRTTKFRLKLRSFRLLE